MKITALIWIFFPAILAVIILANRASLKQRQGYVIPSLIVVLNVVMFLYAQSIGDPGYMFPWAHLFTPFIVLIAWLFLWIISGLHGFIVRPTRRQEDETK